MKTKFQSSVAGQIPKTKKAKEPRLPWEVNRFGFDQKQELDRPSSIVKAPLETRPVFLIVLLLFIFFSVAYIFVRSSRESRELQKVMLEKERAAMTLESRVLALQANALSIQNRLDKATNEKDTLENKTTLLRKELGDLVRQNQILVSAIEDLSTAKEEAVVAVKSLEREDSFENVDVKNVGEKIDTKDKDNNQRKSGSNFTFGR